MELSNLQQKLDAAISILTEDRTHSAQIALYLQDQLITGYASSAFSCPVAQWLRHQLGDNVAVVVGKKGICAIAVPSEDWEAEYAHISFDTAHPVMDLIKEIDDGDYLHLLRDRE